MKRLTSVRLSEVLNDVLMGEETAKDFEDWVDYGKERYKDQ